MGPFVDLWCLQRGCLGLLRHLLRLLACPISEASQVRHHVSRLLDVPMSPLCVFASLPPAPPSPPPARAGCFDVRIDSARGSDTLCLPGLGHGSAASTRCACVGDPHDARARQVMAK